MKGQYVGRFAPSPTGPLHFGSLVAALAGYLDARHHQGSYLLRIEDLDPPRESPEAPARIMAQLEGLGITFDGDVCFQSTRLPAYEAALAQLAALDLTFTCTCSRANLPAVYPGTCREKRNDPQAPFAIRVRTTSRVITFEDAVFGLQHCHLDDDVGDFVIKRKDGLIAYQLAVVVDDAWQGITHIVRGHDLLDSTPRQLYLMQLLGYPPPQYAHLPVITGADGHKLSKQTFAREVDETDPVPALKLALAALGQDVPRARQRDDVLKAAVEAWRMEAVPRTASIRMDSIADNTNPARPV